MYVISALLKETHFPDDETEVWWGRVQEHGKELWDLNLPSDRNSFSHTYSHTHSTVSIMAMGTQTHLY